MALPNKDQIKYDIIKKLSYTHDVALLDYCVDAYGDSEERSYAYYDIIIRELINDNIIYCRDEDSIWYSLEPKGEEINSVGGWFEYKKILKNQEYKQSKIEAVSNEKALNDLKLSKLQLQTFWPLFLIALFGGLCGIASLVWQIFFD